MQISSLKFERVRTLNDPHEITIGFSTGAHHQEIDYSSKFDGPGGVMAHAFSPSAGGDLHFDFEPWQKWSDGSEGSDRRFIFSSVAVHEIGHSLGKNYFIML